MSEAFEQELAQIREDIKNEEIKNNNPLAAIPHLAFEQELSAIRNRIAREDIERARQVQNINEHGYITNPFLRQFSNWSVGISDTATHALLNTPAELLGELGFEDTAKWLFDLDAAYRRNSQSTFRDVNGANPTTIDNMFHGFGTSTGHALVGWGVSSLAAPLLPGWAATGLGYLARNLSEAVTEAGNAVSETYEQNPNRFNDALMAGRQSFAVNAPMDMLQSIPETALSALLDKFLFPNAGKAGKTVWDYAKQLGAAGLRNLIVEEANELAQETRQQAIEEAVKNTFASGDMSWGNYWGNLNKELFSLSGLGKHFNDVALPTMGSTALSALFFAPFGMGGGGVRTVYGYNKLKKQTETLSKQREELQSRIDSLRKENTPESIKEAEKNTERLRKLNDKIAKITGEITVYESRQHLQDMGINDVKQGQEYLDNLIKQRSELKAELDTLTAPNADPNIDNSARIQELSNSITQIDDDFQKFIGAFAVFSDSAFDSKVNDTFLKSSPVYTENNLEELREYRDNIQKEINQLYSDLPSVNEFSISIHDRRYGY